MDVRSVQQQIMDHKRRMGFNVTNVPLELCLLQAEIAEFFEGWRCNQPDVGQELADVAIYVLSLADMLGIDLETEIANKMSKNAKRTYVERDGVLVKREEIETR